MPAQIANAITFQQLCDKLDASIGTSPDTRARLSSAVIQFCELSGLDRSVAIANGSTFGASAAVASWREFGLTKGSWASLKSRVVMAMALGGVTVRLRHRFKANPEWETFLAGCDEKVRLRLSGFAEWCTGQGVTPNGVNTAIFEGYLRHQIQNSILVHPRERWHLARRTWNSYVASRAGNFAQVPSHLSNMWRSLPLSAFPASLSAEIENWRAYMLRPDPFRRVGSSDPLWTGSGRGSVELITARLYIGRLRQSASRLVEAGWRPEDFASLGAFVDPHVAEAGLRQLWGEGDFDEARPRMQALMTAILSLANYLDIDGERRKQLRRLAKIVSHHPTGMSDRNRDRLRPLTNRAALTRLTRLPIAVDKRLSQVETPTVRQALLMQMAVLLELLLHVPMRVKNAALLDLGRHFERPAASGGGCWRLNIKKGEVKNHRPIEAELSEETSAFFDRYVSVFRPALSRGRSNAFFVSSNGQQKKPNALAKQFSTFVCREAGLTINIHLMRHLVTSTYLQANPGDYEGARQLLGHKHIATTINIYAGVEAAASFKRLDDLVSQTRTWRPEGVVTTLDSVSRGSL